ncbi:S23 ribosomal protein [Pirellula staleyi DSM 6068]|uniref:S23 ribosomal protein n=1 Tax=Pirellula staleyi (strain ATCC 27377 / DSM 6068 / ICPB 4128) TaxID=530564 RepID=D2R4T7_PIRSD|nr:four helix bundle protein [Pirellula staleyi]ADB17153.1 S23 ribosomal protein [Pirellula staleyi DSM 6068]
MKSYRELRVWQLSVDLAVEICLLLENFPKHELFGICSQLRRCAVSIPSNIAEGHQRDSTREFLKHLSIACGSLAELETQLLISERLGYLKPEKFSDFTARLQELGRMINGLQNSLRRKLD